MRFIITIKNIEFSPNVSRVHLLYLSVLVLIENSMDRRCRFSILPSMITLACQRVFRLNRLNRQIMPTGFRKKGNNRWILVLTSFCSYKSFQNSKLVISKGSNVSADRIDEEIFKLISRKY